MEEYKWYSGRYDRVFKEVMLKKSNNDLLTMLLEYILKIKINNITILNNEKLMTNVHIRSQRLDLNLDTNIGKINVEVNSTDETYIPYRNFAFLTDIYSHDVLVGHEYDSNKQYIQINLSYGLSKNRKDVEIYKMRDIDGRTYLDNFILYNINMDNYTNKINEIDTKDLKDDIILIMLAQDRDILIKLAKKYKVVAKYMKEVDEVNKDPEFREYMSKEEDDMKIKNSLIKEATENGFNKGIEQGIKQGIEQSKIGIVNNLLNTDMTIFDISKIVNLKEEEIIKIKDAK